MPYDEVIKFNNPHSEISLFSYLSFLLQIFFSKLIGCRAAVFNLPLETQYPYIYHRFWKGERFISFAEKTGNFFKLKVYWKNTCPNPADCYERINLSISWNMVPKNINLLIDTVALKKLMVKISKVKKEIVRLNSERKKHIAIVDNTLYSNLLQT